MRRYYGAAVWYCKLLFFLSFVVLCIIFFSFLYFFDFNVNRPLKKKTDFLIGISTKNQFSKKSADISTKIRPLLNSKFCIFPFSTIKTKARVGFVSMTFVFTFFYLIFFFAPISKTRNIPFFPLCN